LSLRPLPDLNSITVEQPCPVCDEKNWISLKEVDATEGYECQRCHAVTHLSASEEADVRDRIAHKFSEIIRLG
jgi:phage FluMu protein Com